MHAHVALDDEFDEDGEGEDLWSSESFSFTLRDAGLDLSEADSSLCKLEPHALDADANSSLLENRQRTMDSVQHTNRTDITTVATRSTELTATQRDKGWCRSDRLLLVLLLCLLVMLLLMAFYTSDAVCMLLLSSFVAPSDASRRKQDRYEHKRYLIARVEYEAARMRLSPAADYLNIQHSCVVQSALADVACLLPPVDVSIVRNITLVLTSCGPDHRELTATCLKSWVLHTPPSVHLHVYLLSDDVSVQQPWLERVIARWPLHNSFEVVYVDIVTNLPSSHHQYLNEFRRCSPARLFAPYLLPDVDAIVYVDVDSLLVSDPRSLWADFQRFGPSHWLAMAWENDNGRNGLNWYINKNNCQLSLVSTLRLERRHHAYEPH
jgi:hypothetical protein